MNRLSMLPWRPSPSLCSRACGRFSSVAAVLSLPWSHAQTLQPAVLSEATSGGHQQGPAIWQDQDSCSKEAPAGLAAQRGACFLSNMHNLLKLDLTSRSCRLLKRSNPSLCSRACGCLFSDAPALSLPWTYAQTIATLSIGRSHEALIITCKQSGLLMHS